MEQNMRIASYIYFSNDAPTDLTQLWVKPVGNDTYSLQIFNNGAWRPLVGSGGKSAYELAVEKGYTGTLDEWLLSLKGIQGNVGPQGEQGPAGPQGPQGEAGTSVTDISYSSETPTSTTYIMTFSDGSNFAFSIPKGQKGDKGDTGETGATGETGPKGDKGDTGAAGTNGTNGVDGEDAYQPFKGWFDSSSDLENTLGSPEVGDYAYVKGATASDPVAIYQCTTAGTWTDSGHEFNPANNQEFLSGESLDAVRIVDDLTTGGATNVLSAKQGKELKSQIDTLGPKIDKIQGELVDKVELDLSGLTYSVGYNLMSGEKRAAAASTPRAVVDDFVNCNGFDAILVNTLNSCYFVASYYTAATEDDFLSATGTWSVSGDTLSVPSGAKFFRLCLKCGSAGTAAMPTTLSEAISSIKLSVTNNIASKVSALQTSVTANANAINAVDAKIIPSKYEASEYIDFGHYTLKLNPEQTRAWGQGVEVTAGMKISIKSTPIAGFQYALSLWTSSSYSSYTYVGSWVSDETLDYVTTDDGWIRIAVRKTDDTQLVLSDFGALISKVSISGQTTGYVENVAKTTFDAKMNEIDDRLSGIYGSGTDNYFGKLIKLDYETRNKCNKVILKIYDKDTYSSWCMWLCQSATKYGNYIFLAYQNSNGGQSEGVGSELGNSDIVVLNGSTYEPTTRFNCGFTNLHNNNIQFTDIFYSDSDEFPLCLITDGIGTSTVGFKVVRITRDGTTFTGTTIATISSDSGGCSYCYDPQTRSIIAFGYKNILYNMNKETNSIIMYVWRLPSLTSDGTLNKESVVTQVNLGHWAVVQGCFAKNGKVYMYNTSEGTNPETGLPYNNIDVGLWVIDEVSGVVESIVSIPRNWEAEGLYEDAGTIVLVDRHLVSFANNLQLVQYTF